MEKRSIQTKDAPAAVGPYSQGVAAGQLLFVSGQLGLHPETGRLAGDAFEAQARQALDNMRAVLVAGGSDLEKVLSVDVFLTDMERFAEFNAIYAGYFDDCRPARAAVEVSRLPKDALVEVRCIAYF